MIKEPRQRRFGLNYVPSRNWYYCWNDWDAESIARDFDAIAALEVDHLRVMTLWPYFQPNATRVSPAHLARLRELMELAAERNLDVLLCPLTGWLSGYRFLPPDVDPLAIFRDPAVFERSTLYFEALLETVSENSRFLGFDLGNEINVLAPHLPASDGDSWGKKLTSWLRPRMGGKWIVNGVDHNPWFNGLTFSARHLVEEYDAVTVHAWPLFTGCLLRGGLADAPSAHLSAFLTQMCRDQMSRAGVEKPVWIQEFGCSSLWGSEEEKAAYLAASVENAVRAGATWFTWWCSHDIDRQFRFDPLEYDLGLLSTENSEKPLAAIFRNLIREYRHSPAETAPLFPFDPSFEPALIQQLGPGNGIAQNLQTTAWREFDRYLASPDTPLARHIT